MKIVKYFLILMNVYGLVSAAESSVVNLQNVNLSGGSHFSMRDRIEHIETLPSFHRQFIAACKYRGNENIWATCSSEMEGELWARGKDGEMVSLGQINPPADFGLTNPIEDIRLFKTREKMYFVASNSQGLLLYRVDSQHRTVLGQAARAMGKAVVALGAGVSAVLAAAKDTLQTSKSISHQSSLPVDYLAASDLSSSGHRSAEQESLPVQDALEDTDWYLKSLPGGSIFIQNVLHDIETIENEKNPGILIRGNIDRSFLRRGAFSSLLQYVHVSESGCTSIPCSSKWDEVLGSLKTVSAMKQNGNGHIVFAGVAENDEKIFLGTTSDIEDPQILFTLTGDSIMGGFSDHLVAAAAGLFYYKTSSCDGMVDALENLIKNRPQILAITQNYAISLQDNLLEQISWDSGELKLGKFICVRAGSEPTCFYHGGVLQTSRNASSLFYSFPNDFIARIVEHDSSGISHMADRPSSAVDFLDDDPLQEKLAESVEVDLLDGQQEKTAKQGDLFEEAEVIEEQGNDEKGESGSDEKKKKKKKKK